MTSDTAPETAGRVLLFDRSARLRMSFTGPKAAESLKITARDLLDLKLVDEIVSEPLGGAHNDLKLAAASLKESLLRNLADLRKLSTSDRLKRRYEKFRAHGQFQEKEIKAA